MPLTKNGRVILSAGSYGSPRILFQSGIGPADMIAVVAGNAASAPNLPAPANYIILPVGENVSDNPSINVRLLIFNSNGDTFSTRFTVGVHSSHYRRI